MLRVAAAVRPAFRRCIRHSISPMPNRQPISTAATIYLRIHLLLTSNRRPQISSFRCYARMARRSPPPTRRTVDSNDESESESESEEKENVANFDELDDDDDDGEESEELEGFMMDFGAIGEKNDEDGSNKEVQS